MLATIDRTSQYAKLPHDHEISKQRYQQQEENKYLSLSHLGKSLKNQVGKLSFFSQFRLAEFVKQVVLLWVQNSFCLLKSNLPTAAQRSDKSLFRFAKEDV